VQRNIEICLEGTKVGEVIDDAYVSHRKADTHYYIKGGGYPISNSILKKLKELDVKTIRIVEHGKKAITTYETSLEDYQKAVLIQESDFDQQRVVPIAKMRKVRVFLHWD
jgi:radical SAM superfamily enzyme with C-terminal helix-hairpin-helix motif